MPAQDLRSSPIDHAAIGAPRGGLLYPALPALAAWDGDSLELVHAGWGFAARADGVFAHKLRRALCDGAGEPWLSAALQQHPMRRALDALRGAASVSLTPAAALRLSGFRTLFVELTGCCNQRCLHCYAAAGPQVDSALSRETCDALLDDAAELGFEVVQLTGGEPLTCPFLPHLVRRLARLPRVTCEIFTNGILLDRAMVQQLAPARPSFAFSFYSVDPAIHDRITCTPGSHAATLAAMRRVLGAGLELRAAVVVMPENAHSVAQTVAYLQGLGIPTVSHGRSHDVGRGGHFTGHASMPASTAEAASAAPRPAEPARGRLCVASDGGVYPCIFNRTDLLGQLPEQRLLDVARAPRLVASCSPVERLAQVRPKLSCGECQLTACALAAVGQR